jgi:hypothetical protein
MDLDNCGEIDLPSIIDEQVTLFLSLHCLHQLHIKAATTLDPACLAKRANQAPEAQ